MLQEGKAKDEFWYILETHHGNLTIGFNQKVSDAHIKTLIKKDQLEDVLTCRPVQPGDSFMIKAGTIHSICSSVFLVEIQQASDTSYRLYDYNRSDKGGKKRTLHLSKALKCIKKNSTFNSSKIKKKSIKVTDDYSIVQLTECDYFTVHELIVKTQFKTSSRKETFNVHMCIEGSATIHYSDGTIKVNKGDTLLIPSFLGKYTINGNCKIIDTFI